MSLPVWPMNWQAPELNNWRGMQNVSANSSLLVWWQLGQLSQVLMPPIQTGELLNMLTKGSPTPPKKPCIFGHCPIAI